MTVTLVATPDPPFDRCADCSAPLPERDGPASTDRRCEDCWWRHQWALFDAGRPDEVAPIALPFIERRAARGLRHPYPL